jgi:hypothetical protein
MAAAVLQIVPDHFSLEGFSPGSQVTLEIIRTAKDRVQIRRIWKSTRHPCF